MNPDVPDTSDELIFFNVEDRSDTEEQDAYAGAKSGIFDKLFHESIDLIWSTLSLQASTDIAAPGQAERNSMTETSDLQSDFSKLLTIYRLIQLCRFTRETGIAVDSALQHVLPDIRSLPGLCFTLRGIERKLAFRRVTRRMASDQAVYGQLDMSKFISAHASGIRPIQLISISRDRTFNLPENQLVVALIILTRNWIQRIHHEVLSHYEQTDAFRLISGIFGHLNRTVRAEPFRECLPAADMAASSFISGDSSGLEALLTAVRERASRGLIYNRYYLLLTYWAEELIKTQFNIIRLSSWYLPYADRDKDSVINRLFEFWLLKHIALGFSRRFGKGYDKFNWLANANTEPVYEFLTTTGSNLKIYFQKARGLLWGTEEPDGRWQYQPAYDLAARPQALQGIPDISILIEFNKPDSSRRILIIDAKNRPGKTGVEEVYKMLGYFSNFKERLSPSIGALVFLRSSAGDVESIRKCDRLYGHHDGHLLSISVDPLLDDDTIFKQIDVLVSFCCDHLQLN